MKDDARLRSACLFLLVALVAGSAQATVEEEAVQDPGRVTLDRIFDNDFRSGRFSLRWHEDGKSYLKLEDPEGAEEEEKGKDIVRYEIASGKRRVLVAAQHLIPAGHSEPLALDDYQWSKDRSKLLIYTNSKKVWRRNTRGDYWLLELDSKALRQLGGEAEPATLMFATFSPDGSQVAYVRERNLYVEDLATGEIRQLTETASEDVINATFDWVHEEEFSLRKGFRWSPDSRRLAYWQLDASGTGVFHMLNQTDELYPRLTSFNYPKAGTTNSSSRIGIVAATGGETRWLVDNDDPRNHYLARMRWSGPNEILVQHLNRHQNTLSLLVGNADSGTYRTLFVERDEAWLDAIDDWQDLDDGAWFLWLSERDGWQHAYSISRASGEAKLLTPGEFDVVSIAALDEARGWLYFIASPDDPTQRYLYRAAVDGSGRVERITPEDQPGTHGYRIAEGGGWALHTWSRFDRPTTTQLVSLPDHAVKRVVVENTELAEKVAALDRGEHRFFRVELEDGTELDGWEMRPPDFDPAARYPVLFYVYGEPWGQTVRDVWSGRRYLWHLMLTQRGYLVMSIDNRGTRSPRGREWRKSIYKKVGVLSSADQAEAVRAIGEWDYVDAERVAIWGWSGGGSMTLNMMFRHPELYDVGMSVAPVPDQRYYDTIYQERYQGIPTEDPEVYEEGSPITYADRLEGDLLIVHGTGDDNVHYQGTEALINALVEAGKPFTMMAYPNRSHGISEGEGTSRHLYELLTGYLTENLPAGPAAE